jgi:hypothetical protein
MASQLAALFARAHAEGGGGVAARLALRTRITTQTAATLPDTPEQVRAVTQALDELLREAHAGAASRATAAAAAAPAPARPGSAGTNRITRYFEFAMEHGGLVTVVKLAGKVGVTRQTAPTTPETPDLLAKIRQALTELLPGVQVP